MIDSEQFNVQIDSRELIAVKRSELTSVDAHLTGTETVLTIDAVNYRPTRIQVDTRAKIVRFWLLGMHFECQIEDSTDQLIRALGMDRGASSSIEQICAPMPGLVIDVLVQSDQRVSAGEPLLVLQAMKMENVIKAPVDLHIEEVLVKNGENVDKDAVMIICKPKTA